MFFGHRERERERKQSCGRAESKCSRKVVALQEEVRRGKRSRFGSKVGKEAGWHWDEVEVD